MNKLSNEQLIKYAEEKVTNLTKVIDQSAFTNIKERLIEELQLAQVGLDALRELKGEQVPYAYSYNYAGCETCEGFQDWRKELSRERPPEWMVETGKVTDLVELFTTPQKPVVLPVRVAGQDMRETFNYLMSQEEADSAANGFNQCLIESRAAIESAGCIVKDSE